MNKFRSGFSICHLTSAHDVNDVRIYEKECRSLAKFGYNVTIVAPDTHKVALNDVQMALFSPSQSRLGRFTITQGRLLIKAIHTRSFVYHFHDPDILLLALLLKLLGKRVIYDVHEDYSASIIDKDWIPHVLRNLLSFCWNFVEKLTAKFFIDYIVAATPKIYSNFTNCRAILIQNFPSLHTNMNSPTPHSQRPRWILYHGVLSEKRGLLQLLSSLSLLPSDVRLQLAGQANDNFFFSQLTRHPMWKRVDFHGLLSRSKIEELACKCRVGALLFHPTPNHIASQPNKLFEFMGMGLPIVCSNFPLWDDIVASNNCGFTTDPLSPDAIALSISNIISDPESAEAMAANGLKAVKLKYNWPSEEAKLLSLYNSLFSEYRNSTRSL